MLDERSLDNALMSAQTKANICRRWCRVGSAVEDATYALHHNGLGNSDTDHQRIHNSQRLALSEDALAAVLCEWIMKLHAHKPYDLNNGGVR